MNDASRADALDSGGLDLVVTPGLGFTKVRSILHCTRLIIFFRMA